MYKWIGLLLLAACGTSTDKGETPQPPLTVTVIYPSGGKGDRSFSDVVYQGLVQASLTATFELNEYTLNTDGSADALIDRATSGAAGNGLVLMAGFEFIGPLMARHCAFNDRYMVLMDAVVDPCPRLQSITYRTFGASFLAGVAAITVAPRKTAAFLGGMDLPAVDEFRRGFEAGVAYAGGSMTRAEYISTGFDGFSSVQKAHDMATAFFADADVVFPVAGGSGAGVIEATKDYGNRYTLGVDIDQAYLGRGVILGSVVKAMNTTAQNAVLDVEVKSFAAGHYNAGLSEQGTDFVVNPRFAAAVESALDQARAAALEAAAQDLGMYP